MSDGSAAAYPDEATLLDELRRGSSAAAVLVMQQHNRKLWRIARGILDNDADAEEAVQDTYLRVFSSASTFRGEASLGTWLARVVINEALRRTQGRRAAVDLASLAESLAADHPGSITMAPSAGPEHAAAQAEIRRVVEKAVGELSAPFRVVFMMRVVEQMSIEETAAALVIPPATVKTRLHRANEQLRAALGATFAAALEGAFPFAGARCTRLTEGVLARLPRDGPAAVPLG